MFEIYLAIKIYRFLVSGSGLKKKERSAGLKMAIIVIVCLCVCVCVCVVCLWVWVIESGISRFALNKEATYLDSCYVSYDNNKNNDMNNN